MPIRTMRHCGVLLCVVFWLAPCVNSHYKIVVPVKSRDYIRALKSIEEIDSTTDETGETAEKVEDPNSYILCFSQEWAAPCLFLYIFITLVAVGLGVVIYFTCAPIVYVFILHLLFESFQLKAHHPINLTTTTHISAIRCAVTFDVGAAGRVTHSVSMRQTA